MHSIVIQCNVNPIPNSEDRNETEWEGGNETDLFQDRGVEVSFKNDVEASSSQ